MLASIKSNIILGFLASVLVLIIVGALSYHTTHDLIRTLDQVATTQEVIGELEATLATVAKAETAQRGYLLAGSKEFVDQFRTLEQQAGKQLDQLRRLTADNPEQQPSLNRLEELVAQRMTLLNERIAAREQRGLEAAANADALLQGHELMEEIGKEVAGLRAAEQRLLGQRRKSARAGSRRSLMVIVGSSALACLVGVLAIMVIQRDLRRRERAEAERDRFFNLSHDLMCIAGFDGYFKTVNPAWERVLGLPRAELLAKPFIEFVHPEDRPATLAEAEKLGRGGNVLNFENRYRSQDGTYRWLAWTASAVVPERLMYATARDITEQKRVEHQISRLNADLQHRAVQLETANKELEAFSYSVSHDLRAPLRHINGFVDLLVKQSSAKLDARGQRYLKIIADAARQMGDLIDDLLVFSRMGRAELRHQNVDVTALTHEAVAGFATEIAGRNVVWNISSLPHVHADHAMLRQVLVNLVSNAVKYTRPRDPARVEIGCQESDNGEFVFFVRDNGVGFDMQYADKLFGVFQRLHRSEEFEGTGIGLANVRRIIHRHGGRTWAEGKIDGGATLYFTLPKLPKG